MNNNQQPVHTIRLGNVKAAIWRNEVGEQKNIRHNVTFTRSYRESDQWRDTGSFGRDDLPKIEKASAMAYEWIFANAKTSESVETA